MSGKTRKTHYGWIIVLGGFLAHAIMMIAIQLVPLQLAPISESLSLSNTEASYMISVYGATSGLAAFFWGILADKIGVRKTITMAGATVGVFAILFGLAADSLVKAVIFYGIVGIGAAGVFNATSSKLIGAWFYPDKRGRALSLMTPGAVIFGMLLGAVIPAVSDALGWRQTTVMMGCIALVLAGLMFAIIRNKPADKGLEPIGTPVEEVVESHEDSRSKTLRVFKLPITWHLGSMYIFWQAGYLVISGFLAKSFIEAGATPALAGLAVSTYSLGQLVGQQIFGPLSDRFPRKYVVAFAAAFWALGALAFFFLFSKSIPAMFVIIACMGVGLGMVPVITAMMSDYYPSDLRGTGAGTISTLGMVGRTIGPILGGMVADSLGMLSGAFLFAACMMGISMLITLTLPKCENKWQQQVEATATTASNDE